MGTSAKMRLPFGDWLRQYRRSAHLTQEQLAERSGMSVRAISDLERGARQAPHRDTLRLLVEALGLSADEAAALEAAVVRLRGGVNTGSALPAVPAAPRLTPFMLPPLPSPLSSFVGREAEVAAAIHLLRRGDVRLLTLIGPAGVGKTRLALRTAEVAAADFADGVIFISLASITDPALVLPTIAHVLNIKEVGASVLAALRATLHELRILLLLDNFEQVAAAGPDVVALLQACPGLVALVSSRAALAVQGEQQLPVPPLAVPESGDIPEGNGKVVAGTDIGTVAQYPAVRLLIERAQAVKPDFAPTPAMLPPLVEICRRLDGLPLAIKLAAPRLKVVSPQTLLSRMERLLPALTTGARDLPERQQTMRATIAWSEDLLTEPQRTLFRRLAVFAGSWTLEAAEAVCVAPEGAEPLGLDVLEGLCRLVDHSLIQQREEGGETRFGMLHVIREYALERLAESGEEQEVRRLHCEYCAAFAEAAEPEFRGPRQLALLAQGDREHDNTRAALGWALEQGETELGLRLAGIFWEYWVPRGLQTEGRRWLDALLALDVAGARHPASPAVRAKALRGASIMARQQGDLARARKCSGKSALRFAVRLEMSGGWARCSARWDWWRSSEEIGHGRGS